MTGGSRYCYSTQAINKSVEKDRVDIVHLVQPISRLMGGKLRISLFDVIKHGVCPLVTSEERRAVDGPVNRPDPMSEKLRTRVSDSTDLDTRICCPRHRVRNYFATSECTIRAQPDTHPRGGRESALLARDYQGRRASLRCYRELHKSRRRRYARRFVRIL